MRYGAPRSGSCAIAPATSGRRPPQSRAPCPQPAPESGLARFRNAPGYQRGMQVFKWRVLPDFVFLPIIVFLAVWLGAGGVTQAYLPWLESGTRAVHEPRRERPGAGRVRRHIRAVATPATPSRGVVKGTRYRVELRVDRIPGSTAATPRIRRACAPATWVWSASSAGRSAASSKPISCSPSSRSAGRPVLAPGQRAHHPAGAGGKAAAALRRRVQGRSERRAVRLRQRCRVAARPDVLLHVAPRQEQRQGDTQDRAAPGGPDGLGRDARGPGTRRQLSVASGLGRFSAGRRPRPTRR